MLFKLLFINFEVITRYQIQLYNTIYERIPNIISLIKASKLQHTFFIFKKLSKTSINSDNLNNMALIMENLLMKSTIIYFKNHAFGHHFQYILYFLHMILIMQDFPWYE